jgi:hypothetical protein
MFPAVEFLQRTVAAIWKKVVVGVLALAVLPDMLELYSRHAPAVSAAREVRAC